MKSKSDLQKKQFDTVIIGAGQAGLAIGYYLKKKGADFLIIDKSERIGDSWRKRWDSLVLFTPSQYDGLPGMSFPLVKDSFPSKNQMADYLEKYAILFSLPIELGVQVLSLSKNDTHFEIDSSVGKINANKVVVATGTNPSPRFPAFASELDSKIFQIHSSQYINSASIPDGDTLVVGAGTSGVEIAIELSQTRKTYISGKPTFHIPDNVFKYFGSAYWWLISNILTIKTPMGRRAKKDVLHGGAPLIRVDANQLENSGIKRLPRMAGVKNGLPTFDDETILNVSNIVWCTGFKPDFSWIKMDISDATGWPQNDRGVSDTYKGLYFIGMPFQYSLISGLVGGVGRDAEYLSRNL